MSDARDVIRHYLAALAFRFQVAVRDAPSGFGDFNAGQGVMSPRALVHHIAHLMMMIHHTLTGEKVDELAGLGWKEEIIRFHDWIGKVDRASEECDLPEDGGLEKLIQGPLADAMTHIGQLATLRRLSGSPVPRRHFMKADIQIGRVGPDQNQ